MAFPSHEKASPQMATWVKISPFVPLGVHHTVTIDGAYSPGDQPQGATRLMVQSTAQDVRYTLSDDSTPAADRGFVLTADNVTVIIPVSSRTVIRFFAEAAGAILNYQWGF